MSVHPTPAPTPRRRPGFRPRPSGAPAPGLWARWGWLEWFVLSQTFMPALLFIPGASSVRTAIRVGAFAVALLAWVMIARSGRRAPGGDDFPARPWLLGCIAWLILSVAHPNSYSIRAAVAQVVLYVAVLSPAFWAGRVLDAPRQVSRLMLLLFLCNALSAAVGVAQVFRPGTFNPPVIPALSNRFGGEDLMYEAADGRKILRPCGLTDSPGAAAPAGASAALMGLCWALRPVSAWKRLASLGLAFLGVAAIYYSQVRFPMVMLVICLVGLSAMLVWQRQYGQATMLAVGGAAVVAGALVWVASSVGSGVVNRFASLFGGLGTYQESRGGYIQHALGEVIWQYPLGYGMGWWGTAYASFGDPGRISFVWVEVMIPAWVYDGGFPLLVGYALALVVALLDTARVALTCRDRELAFWAAVVLALNVSVVATCFSFVTFLTQIGMQFWLLAALVHAADRQVRPAARRPPRARGALAR